MGTAGGGVADRGGPAAKVASARAPRGFLRIPGRSLRRTRLPVPDACFCTTRWHPRFPSRQRGERRSGVQRPRGAAPLRTRARTTDHSSSEEGSRSSFSSRRSSSASHAASQPGSGGPSNRARTSATMSSRSPSGSSSTFRRRSCAALVTATSLAGTASTDNRRVQPGPSRLHSSAGRTFR